MKYQHKISLNIIRLAMVLTCSILFFTASGNVQYTVNLTASQNANSSGKGASAPIAVSIYSLASSSRFSKAKYFTLEDSSHRTLRTDLIKKQQVLLLPNKSQSITVESGEDVRYIGIVASYNTLKGKVWRRVVDLKKVELKTITVHIERTRVRVSQPQASKAFSLSRGNKFYIGGSLSVGSVQLQDQYQLNKFNTRAIKANSGGLGPYALDFGYQWQFAKTDGLSFFTSLSLGAQLKMLMNLKTKGDDLNYIHERPVQKTFNDVVVGISAMQYLLVLQSDVVSYKKFSLPISIGVGTSQYSNSYTLIRKSNGDRRQSKEKNSATIYQLGIGVDYQINQSLSFGLGYQYVNGGVIRLAEIVEGSDIMEQPKFAFNQQLVTANLHYYF